ncbi:arylsulfatase D-like isoform X2 [Ahaetulla prasina]|uniref:arylsulfatase D-like isoform X2 n=1 Tax=Ahaetulla prasina TaxID=499056 RepID=UPI002647E685|nr:arylsulfatase D-like isoform X2 [Ahaetulla prasina]
MGIAEPLVGPLFLCKSIYLMTLMAFLILLHTCRVDATLDSKPNIILMLADDLGIGDIGCYGMASRNAYRALQWNAGSGGLPVNETTFAKMLQQQGYVTGLIGKWHQGVSCDTIDDYCHHPLNHGFDYFYGMPFTLFNNCQDNKPPELDRAFQAKLWFYTQVITFAVLTFLIGKIIGLVSIPWKVIIFLALFNFLFFASWYSSYGFVKYWNCILMRNYNITEQPMKLGRTSLILLNEALSFIQSKKHKPFLLLVSFLHVHTPLITTEKFVGKSKHGIYGDHVEELDWLVGQILNAIDKEGLQNSTFVYFASDHGGHLEGQDGTVQVGGWNGIYKVIHLAGKDVPQDRIIDGRNLLPLLQQKIKHSEHEFLFHYCGSYLHAARWHQKDSGALWKAHYVTPIFSTEDAGGCYGKGICPCSGEGVIHHVPPLLFDLSRDPSEAIPLSETTEPHFQEILKKIDDAVAKHRRTLTPVPQQLSYYNIIWKPWLQPCCGTFPFCWCDKEGANIHSN